MKHTFVVGINLILALGSCTYLLLCVGCSASSEAQAGDTGHKSTIIAIVGATRPEAERILGKPTKVKRQHRMFFLPYPQKPQDTDVDICSYTVGPKKLPVQATYAGEDMRELFVYTDLPEQGQWKQALKAVGADPAGIKLGDAYDLAPLPGLPDRFQALWQTPDNNDHPHHWYLKFTVEKQHRVR